MGGMLRFKGKIGGIRGRKVTPINKGAPRKSGIVDEGYFYVKKVWIYIFGHLSGVMNILCKKVVILSLRNFWSKKKQIG